MGKACNGKYGVHYFDGMTLGEVADMWDNYIHTAFID